MGKSRRAGILRVRDGWRDGLGERRRIYKQIDAIEIARAPGNFRDEQASRDSDDVGGMVESVGTRNIRRPREDARVRSRRDPIPARMPPPEFPMEARSPRRRSLQYQCFRIPPATTSRRASPRCGRARYSPHSSAGSAGSNPATVRDSSAPVRGDRASTPHRQKSPAAHPPHPAAQSPSGRGKQEWAGCKRGTISPAPAGAPPSPLLLRDGPPFPTASWASAHCRWSCGRASWKCAKHNTTRPRTQSREGNESEK